MGFFPGSTGSVNRILLAQDSICISLLTSRMVREEGNWGHFENNSSHGLRDIKVHLSLVSLGRVKAALVRASAIDFGGTTIKSGHRHICLWLVRTLDSRRGTGSNHGKSCWPPCRTSPQHHPAGTERSSTLFLTRQFDFHQPWSQLWPKSSVISFLLFSEPTEPTAQCKASSLFKPLDPFLWYLVLHWTHTPPMFYTGKLQKLLYHFMSLKRVWNVSAASQWWFWIPTKTRQRDPVEADPDC